MAHTDTAELLLTFFFVLALADNSTYTHDDAPKNLPIISLPLEIEHGNCKRKNLDVSPIHHVPNKKSNQSNREKNLEYRPVHRNVDKMQRMPCRYDKE